MAIAKIILNGVTQMDLTSDTVVKQTLVTGTTAHRADGVMISGAFSPVIPVGTLSITSNGTYDVTDYANASVNVAGGGTDYYGVIIGRNAHAINDINTHGNVSAIGPYAFYSYNSPTSLMYVDLQHVSVIGSSAFAQCAYLEAVSFSTATIIESFAFYSDVRLSKVDAPNIVTVGASAFASCNQLKSVNFLETVGTIGSSAFASCNSSATALNSICFSSLTSIGRGLFFYNNAVQHVEMPLISSLPGGTFTGCYNLQDAFLPNVSAGLNGDFCSCSKLTTVSLPLYSGPVGNNTFANCLSLTSVYLKNISGTINSTAFASCQRLEYLDDITNVTNVSTSAFAYCFSLGIHSTLMFSNLAATSIGSSAFIWCRELSAIVLGNQSVTSGRMISNSAFYGCSKLLSVYLLFGSIWGLQTWAVFAYTPISSTTSYTGGVNGSVFVPESLYNTYISYTNWATYSSRIVSLTNAQIQNVLTYGTHEPQV